MAGSVATGRAYAHATNCNIRCDLTTRSGVRAEVDADAVPLSPALRAVLGRDAARACALRGGDDYELCFTAAADQREALHAVAESLRLPLTRIGRIVEGQGVQCEGETGPGGYQHFAE